MRTAATARPRRPSDVKNRWVTETDPEVGSGKSSRCEALADTQRGHNTRCVGLEKARLSGREHLAGVRWEIKTHCFGQVKTER